MYSPTIIRLLNKYHRIQEVNRNPNCIMLRPSLIRHLIIVLSFIISILFSLYLTLTYSIIGGILLETFSILAIYTFDRLEFFHVTVKNAKIEKDGFICKDVSELEHITEIEKLTSEPGDAFLSYKGHKTAAVELFPAWKKPQFRIDECTYPLEENEYTLRFRNNNENGNHGFTSKDLLNYGRATEARLSNDMGFWITRFRVSRARDSIEIGFVNAEYFKRWCLNWHLVCKFNEEKDFPSKIVMNAVAGFLNNRREALDLSVIPATLGTECLVITKDDFVVLAKRSHSEATDRLKYTLSSSGALDPEDFLTNTGGEKKQFNEAVNDGARRELNLETGLGNLPASNFRLISVVDFTLQNAISFVFLVRIDLNWSEIRTMVESKNNPEGWEISRIKVFPKEEILKFNGNWKKFFEKNRARMTSRLMSALAILQNMN